MSQAKRWHRPNILLYWDMCAAGWSSAVHMVSLDMHCSYNWPRLDTHGAGERTSRDRGRSDFSNVRVWFDPISLMFNFKPFPTNVSLQFLFLQCAFCSCLPIFPEIPPSCFCLEVDILDIGTLTFTGSTWTSQVSSVPRQGLGSASPGPLPRQGALLQLGSKPKASSWFGKAILPISNLTLIFSFFYHWLIT